MMKVICNKSNPPLGGLLAVEYYRDLQKNIEVIWSNESSVTLPGSTESVPYRNSYELIKILENTFNDAFKQSSALYEKMWTIEWLAFSVVLDEDIPKSTEHLDKTLNTQTYLFGDSLTVSDLAIFSVLYVSTKFKDVLKDNPPSNIIRWMELIETKPPVAKALRELPPGVLDAAAKAFLRSPLIKTTSVGRRQAGKLIELPHAEKGKVVVRFQCTASGYLHIGHAKNALLNQYYQQEFQGKLVLRFNDTNPTEENADFEKVILEDLEMLEIKPDVITHTSHYFDLMMEYCVKLIEEGKAFVDDTPSEQMEIDRDQKLESKNRNSCVEKNLQLWEEMKRASAVGAQCCVRAKIDMQSANGCLRDPTIYRCKPEVHPRTGTQYKVYPTYDFACPIVDSVEGVTHVLRTMEYHDRDEQFYWFIDAIGLRKPFILKYSRLKMTNTVLSRRKLAWFVEQGLVDGWDDPRMPTVRGVLRRGVTVEALRRLVEAQGSAGPDHYTDWDDLWAINNKLIDPIAPHYTVIKPCPQALRLVGVESTSSLTVLSNPKNPDVGTKKIWVSKRLLVDREDANILKQGEYFTLIDYGTILIDRIRREADGSLRKIECLTMGDGDYENAVKLSWLSDSIDSMSEATSVVCVYYDHIISKPLLEKDEDFKQYTGHRTKWEFGLLGESALGKVEIGDIVYVQRRGFFRVDNPDIPCSNYKPRPTPITLFHIPDGRTKVMPGQDR